LTFRHRRSSSAAAAECLFLCWPKEKVTKKKWLPEQSNPAIGSAFGIFVLAIPWLGPKTAAVHGRRPSGLDCMPAFICRSDVTRDGRGSGRKPARSNKRRSSRR